MWGAILGAPLGPLGALTGAGAEDVYDHYNPPPVAAAPPPPPRPTRPDYASAYDPLNMSLAAEYEKQLAGIKADPRGLEKYREEALRTGPSSWARMATDASRFEEDTERDRGARESMSRANDVVSNLAQHGGVSAGARERAVRGGARDYLNMSQAAARAGQGSRMNIGIQDEANRINQLGALPGMEQAAAGFELDKVKAGQAARDADIQRQIQEAKDKNAFNMGLYQENMAGWAADKQGNAIEKSGK
jgi:hypothetical protein